MIVYTDHADKVGTCWYLGAPGHYAVFNELGRFTGKWAYSKFDFSQS